MSIKLFSILNFVRKQMMKTDKDGIMKLPSELKAKYGEAVITKQLIDAGVDPRTIKNEQQLINILDSIDAMKRKTTTKPGTTGIMKTKEAEVFDLQGNKLDPDKKIMGGTQETEDMIKKKLQKQNEQNIEKMRERRRKEIEQDMDDLFGDPTDPDDTMFADGGRIGLKDGMDRRTFMKILGGLATLPILGRYFKGAEKAAPVVEKAVDVASGAPPYFFNLVDRIRALGKKFSGPKERSESYIYKDYEMDIDLDTGKIDIKKTREAMIPGGDEAGVAEEVYMTYKPGVADETTKGGKVIDEYEELTARPDIDGKMKDVEEGVPDEVVREGSIGKEQLEEEIVEQITRDKKASGGLAYMLGE